MKRTIMTYSIFLSALFTLNGCIDLIPGVSFQNELQKPSDVRAQNVRANGAEIVWTGLPAPESKDTFYSYQIYVNDKVVSTTGTLSNSFCKQSLNCIARWSQNTFSLRDLKPNTTYKVTVSRQKVFYKNPDNFQDNITEESQQSQPVYITTTGGIAENLEVEDATDKKDMFDFLNFTALTWRNGELWGFDEGYSGDNNVLPRLLKIDPTTQKVVQKIQIDQEATKDMWYNGGNLAWDGQHFWMLTFKDFNQASILHKIDPQSGQQLASYPLSLNKTFIPKGLTWDGQNLWATSSHNHHTEIPEVIKIDSNGKVLNTYSPPGPSPSGMSWDGKHLWIMDDETDQMYQIETQAFKVLKSNPTPGVAPVGLAWDGQKFWHKDFFNKGLYKLN